MNWRKLGRQSAVVAEVLIAVSLFCVLIWWQVSVVLFVLGAAVLCVSWLMDDLLLPPSSVAPE